MKTPARRNHIAVTSPRRADIPAPNARRDFAAAINSGGDVSATARGGAAAHYAQIARALPWLAADARRCWKNAAARAGLSPFYFQRVFKKHTGVSPRQYAACVTLADIKARLAAGESVLAAALDAGMSGGGRAHDLFIAVDAATPGEFRRRGGGIVIRHGVAASPAGAIFVAATARGVCRLDFLAAGADEAAARRRLARQWPAARYRRDDALAAALAAEIFGGRVSPLHVRGTNFQINVWRALLALPAGAVISYGALARATGGGNGGARAAARAVASNPVAALIPCHRVLAADGRLSGYAWGADKKRALLAREFAAADAGAGAAA